MSSAPLPLDVMDKVALGEPRKAPGRCPATASASHTYGAVAHIT